MMNSRRHILRICVVNAKTEYRVNSQIEKDRWFRKKVKCHEIII